MFVIMVVLISSFCAFVVIAGGLLRVARGETFWPSEDGESAPASRKVRSAPFRKQFSRANSVQHRSPRSNAEKPSVQAVLVHGSFKRSATNTSDHGRYAGDN
jgi:hypothetical protein